MTHLTDWIMIGVTVVYVITTILIWRSNKASVKAAQAAIEESRKQFEKNIALQKQHNFDSVRPAVSIDFESANSAESYKGRVTLTNHGLGPAIIKSLHFQKGEIDYNNINGYCTLFDLVCLRIDEEQLDRSYRNVFHRFYTKEFRDNDDNNDYLAVDEKIILLEFNAINKPEADIVGKIFHGITMELTYTDVYRSQDWKAVSRLSYFKPDRLNK